MLSGREAIAVELKSQQNGLGKAWKENRDENESEWASDPDSPRIDAKCAFLRYAPQPCSNTFSADGSETSDGMFRIREGLAA